MSKVFIGVGHGGSDSGAVSYLREKDVNLVTALKCRDELLRHGVQVRMSRVSDEEDTLIEEINECNAYNPDLAIGVHNNAGGGDGFEAFYSIVGGTGKQLAENIEAEVKKIGQNSRGCKTRRNEYGSDWYGWIRQTKCPAIILEGCFVDNVNDYKIADTKEKQEAFGIAYAKGILKTLGIAYQEATKKDHLYRVRKSWDDAASQIGAFIVVENAKRFADRNPGYKVFDPKGIVIYPQQTITLFDPHSTNVQLACMVWQGQFGVGQTRKKALGNRYAAVQSLVDKGVGQSKKSSVTCLALADEVMAGLWGNGQSRKDTLESNGFDYYAVQTCVNRKYA